MNALDLRQLVIPAYLFLCLLLGGSAQAVWGNMVLQLLGLAIIFWALVEPRSQRLLPPARHLLWLAIAAIAVVLVQLVPLPVSVWSALGPRGPIVEGYRILGIEPPSLPISLAPYRTVDSLLMAIPPLAVIVGVVRLKAFRSVFAAGAIIAGTVAGICLSALQVSTAQSANSPWYLYPVTNIGFGVGFFANANHMASLLLLCLPFIAALVPAARGTHVQRFTAFAAIAAALALLILIGIALNGSLAGYGLVVPVALASLLLVIRPGSPARGAIIGLAVAFTVAAVGILATSGIGGGKFGVQADESAGSRIEIWGPTLGIARDYLPFGTGLGTFRPVYAMNEDPASVISTYVIHAHNDYAEWVMELGVPGVILLLLFLAWWLKAVITVWRRVDSGPFARAASIASAALLAHSLVDFPLRTSALASAFALCLALLADRRPAQQSSPGDLRPTRHVVIG